MAQSAYDDVPMSLGDHLEELRRRLVWPLITLAALFMTAFAFEAKLQWLFVQPLEWAYHYNPEYSKAVGLELPIRLKTHELIEAVLASMMVSFYAAFFLSFPVLVYHIWKFVGVGLLPRERRLAFLFVPAGIMFFYAGTLIGYFIGLPAFYSFMIKWAAHNPIVQFDLQLKSYHHNFVMMTMVFGLIADIPWLIMVIVRVGFVTVEQLLKNWKIAIFICTAIAAVVAPPDALSMIIMMGPLYGLFFLGVGLSAVMMRRHKRLAAQEEAAELARMAQEEREAHEAHAAAAARAARTAGTPAVVADPSQGDARSTTTGDSSQPVPRSAITDDLVARDQAPSSDDAPGTEEPLSGQPAAQGVTTGEPAANQPGTPGPSGDGVASDQTDGSPRKDDDRG
jgi:sec-independent protein translocase protein TatC